MLYAVKANKELKIEESEKAAMQKQGFDIVSADDKGKRETVAYGAGKTMPADKYAELEKKNEALEKELAKLKKSAKEAKE
ncbi:MAG TPA: hypothetical protein VIK21_08575 [Desulfuromonadaceae bacterium]